MENKSNNQEENRAKKEKDFSENQCGIVSRNVMCDKRINLISKVIYCYLRCFVNDDNCTSISKENICRDLKITRSTFDKYVKELIACGYISISHKKVNGRYGNNIYSFSAENSIVQNTDNNVMTAEKTVAETTQKAEETAEKPKLSSNSGINAVEYYKSHINNNAADIEVLQQWLEKGFDERVVIECINTAVRNDKKFLNYVIGILKNLEQKNVKSYSDYVENKRAFFEKRK